MIITLLLCLASGALTSTVDPVPCTPLPVPYNFGSCSDPGIHYERDPAGSGSEGYAPANNDSFPHAWSADIADVESFICNTLADQCNASALSIDACFASFWLLSGLSGHIAVNSWNDALGVGNGQNTCSSTSASSTSTPGWSWVTMSWATTPSSTNAITTVTVQPEPVTLSMSTRTISITTQTSSTTSSTASLASATVPLATTHASLSIPAKSTATTAISEATSTMATGSPVAVASSFTSGFAVPQITNGSPFQASAPRTDLSSTYILVGLVAIQSCIFMVLDI